MLSIIALFLVNLSLTNYLLQASSLKEHSIVFNGLQLISDDLNRINFPGTVTVSLIFVASIIAAISTLLIYFTVLKSADIDNIENILTSFITLFFIHSFSCLSIFYLLRIYNLPRGLILLNLIFYPFIMTLVIFTIKYFDFNKVFGRKYFGAVVTITLIAGTVFYLSEARYNNVSYQTKDQSVNTQQDTETIVTTTTLLQDSEIDGEYFCYKWSGSINFKECIKGTQVKIVDNFGASLNNIVSFNQDLYLLNVDGIIYKNNKDEIFLDLREKILSRISIGRGANGLFGMAFHPSGEYLLVTYSDHENNFILERYLLDNNLQPVVNNEKIVLKIPNGSLYHFAGSIIWSDYFQDFLINVGDMDAAQNPIIKSEALYTNSPRGKILFYESLVSNPELIGENPNHTPRKDILGYGLRNPWQTFEYKNLLFIPDIGNTAQEELNLINLDDYNINNNEPFLFGWPVYEGMLENTYKYTEVSLWEQGVKKNANEYIAEKSSSPVIYYNHDSPDTYRAALIGGVVISDQESIYYEHYIFAEYFAKEIYAYDFNKDELFQYPLPQNFESYITSVSLHPKKKDTLLISIGNGNLAEVTLPGS